MSDKFLLCEGRATGNGGSAVEFTGAYAAPPGPDWRWRTVHDTPEGAEAFAVEAIYEKSD